MTRDLLFRLINQRLFGQLFLIALACSFSWIVIAKLQLRIVEARVALKKILPYAVIGSMVNLFIIKLFLRSPVAALAQIAMMVIFLKIICKKVRMISAFWATFISLMSTTFGSYLIYTLFCFWDNNIRTYMLTNEYGMILGTLAETVGPLILLHILSTFNFSVTFLLSKKLTRVDLIGVPAFGLMYFSLYNSTTRFVSTVRNNPQEMVNVLFSDLGSILASVLGAFLIVASVQKMREIERKQHEIERKHHESKQRELEMEKNELSQKYQELQELYQRAREDKLDSQDLEKLSNILHTYGDLIIKNLNASTNLEPNLLNLPVVEFTDREQDVVRLIAKGYDNKRIARELYLSGKYVVNIIVSIKAKIVAEIGDISERMLVVYAVYWVRMNKK